MGVTFVLTAGEDVDEGEALEGLILGHKNIVNLLFYHYIFMFYFSL